MAVVCYNLSSGSFQTKRNRHAYLSRLRCVLVSNVEFNAVKYSNATVPHYSSTTCFQTSRYCLFSKVEFNLINWARHRFETFMPRYDRFFVCYPMKANLLKPKWFVITGIKCCLSLKLYFRWKRREIFWQGFLCIMISVTIFWILEDVQYF